MLKLKSFVLFLCLVISGCATLGSLDKSAQVFTHNAIIQSEEAFAAGALTDTQFKAINVELNKIAVAGLTFTQLLAAGQATPASATQFLELITQEIGIIKDNYQALKVDKILINLTRLQTDIQKIKGKL
jgi:hypothetical protein